MKRFGDYGAAPPNDSRPILTDGAADAVPLEQIMKRD